MSYSNIEFYCNNMLLLYLTTTIKYDIIIIGKCGAFENIKNPLDNFSMNTNKDRWEFNEWHNRL